MESLKTAVGEVGLGMVVKTWGGGYDGKGELVLGWGEEMDEGWGELGRGGEVIGESLE